MSLRPRTYYTSDTFSVRGGRDRQKNLDGRCRVARIAYGDYTGNRPPGKKKHVDHSNLTLPKNIILDPRHFIWRDFKFSISKISRREHK